MSKLHFLVFFVAVRAMAGTEIGGGGGDTSPLAHSAWFADGGKPVSYCVQVSKDFGVDEIEAKKIIVKVMQKWESYLSHKKINHKIVLKYDDPVPCDGNQELAFYLGVRNPEVEKYIVSYNNPAAFSERTDYKIWKKRGKGFIWLAASGKVFPGKFPKWAKPGHLEAMLTHELSHVLGCAHVKGTIMTSELSKKL